MRIKYFISEGATVKANTTKQFTDNAKMADNRPQSQFFYNEDKRSGMVCTTPTGGEKSIDVNSLLTLSF